MIVLFGAGLAKCPPVVSDRPVANADIIELCAPHATIAQVGMEKNDGAADDFGRERGEARADAQIGSHDATLATFRDRFHA